MKPSDPGIVYEGRFVVDEHGAVQLGFPGVTAHLRVRDATLSLKLRASQPEIAFDVIVDGGQPRLLQLKEGEGDYSVIAAPLAGEHTVALVRCNESWQGTCAILGYDLGPGKLVAPPVLPARKLMFIGDSVTCGEMDAWKPSRDMHDRLNCDARVSYGMLLAQRLGAQCHLVSYGGRGVIRDWQGIRDTRNAPQFYELALPDGPEIAWDHQRYVPDAIGIQLGTNDFSQGIPDQNEFVNAYVQFVEKVRRDAPNALVFLMDSPIVRDDPVGGPRRSVLRSYLEQVIVRCHSPHVILMPVSHYPGVPNNGHPTGADHKSMADEIEPVLRKALGW
ncbi:MAG TPA: GDSL-type esterase/lipase family protein [Candidatus Didemnitutus sp.]|nr:GDSL-type esterase/lipase family protein [Candidatus Didemnitutus sp.]